MKIISVLVNRLEPGQLWVHLARPGQGGMTVTGMIANLAIKRAKDVVVFSYDGSISGMLPDDMEHREFRTQSKVEKPNRYPAFVELTTVVVPVVTLSRRSFVVVDAARMSEALCDLDDWKALAKDMRRPMMIYWQLEPDEDPEDFDPGEADYLTWSSYDAENEDELVIRKVHEPG